MRREDAAVCQPPCWWSRRSTCIAFLRNRAETQHPAPFLPSLLPQVRQLKQGANALTDEASQLRYKLSQAKGQTELLRGQIVQSPQKIQVGAGRGRQVCSACKLGGSWGRQSSQMIQLGARQSMGSG